jgi:hypothetical protein
MNRNILFGDITFYLIFPIVLWNFSRDYIGDYYAMLLTSLPGFVYSIVRLFLIKKVNLFGIFTLSSLLIGTLIDVLSGSAINILWNNILYSYLIGLIFILTNLIKKPISLYIALDFVEMQGHSRIKMKEIFYQKRILLIFKLITFGFAFRDILLATIKIWLVFKYGVDSFTKGIILRQILNWSFTGISIYGYIYIAKTLNNDIKTDSSSQA